MTLLKNSERRCGQCHFPPMQQIAVASSGWSRAVANRNVANSIAAGQKAARTDTFRPTHDDAAVVVCAAGVRTSTTTNGMEYVPCKHFCSDVRYLTKVTYDDNWTLNFFDLLYKSNIYDIRYDYITFISTYSVRTTKVSIILMYREIFR